ncbi:hypothetical protein WJX73_009440 [Symbiochloris irregularis]|uniref:Tr-type G domain-containing protein n=1 Tax=Symbiochloris irregularis TaxID=706552 RepID=A0AAW1NIC1_9CHLO
MPGGKRGANTWYDEDDMYDDEDYDDEEQEAYQAPVKLPQQARAIPVAAPAKVNKQPAGSSLAKAMNNKGQQQAIASKGSAQKQQPEQVQRFDFSTPSPDDTVRAAQKGARASTSHQSRIWTPGQAEATAGTEAATAGMQQLAVADPTNRQTNHQQEEASQPQPAAAQASAPPLSAYTMEADLARACSQAGASSSAASSGEKKKPGLHLAVLGHVDAGKSTLMGRLMHELGHISAREVQKRQQQANAAGKGSFAWAWMLDERPEERSRGVTIDVATAHFSTPQREVTLLDAPGHRDFVPNMITGAAQADAALLLVDGSTGGFESGFRAGGANGGGQTREHAQLARCLGIENLVVVISKLDTCDFSQERFQEIRSALQAFLLGQCGYREASLQWLPASAPLGENLTQQPKDPRLAAWWQGPTLVQAIDSLPSSAASALEKPLRMPITGVGKGPRGGISVSGRLAAGALKEGTPVLVLPSHQPATVKSLLCNGSTTPSAVARAGDSADVVLSGLVDDSALGPGSVLCHPTWQVPMAAKITARVAVLDVPIPVLTGQPVTIHVHTAQEAGQISSLVSLLDAKTGEVSKQRPRAVLKGQSAVVQITPVQPMCVEVYSDFRTLGRIVLRDGGTTLAVGIITGLAMSS